MTVVRIVAGLHVKLLSIVGEWLAPLRRIAQAPGPNLGPKTVYTGWGLS
jgi:hypothetical protein